MRNLKILTRVSLGSVVAAMLLLTGCQSGKESHADMNGMKMSSSAPATSTAPAAPAAPAAAAAPAAPAAPSQPVVAATPPPAAPAASAFTPVRIKAGVTSPFTDSEGNVWLPDQGFADGETTERAADLQIADTKDPALYRTERYLMTSFSWPVPNGKYRVKLHFAETYEGISGPGERVFSFNVEGHPFDDLDLYAKAGPNHAYVVTVDVEVTDGKLDIKFTPKVENPEINGIEILPAS